MRHKTRTYFCGGTGLNIGLEMQHEPGTCFVDTCDKNVTSQHDFNRIHLTQGTRGGGADRRLIYGKVKPQIPEIISALPPGDFNIVVFGLSGASGAVLGPLIASHLLAAGETVVLIGIEGNEATERLQNAVDTIKTLEGIAVHVKAPVVINYVENIDGVAYASINEEVIRNLHALHCLTNQKNKSLDIPDVDHWVRYNRKRPNLMSQLSHLSIHDNRNDAAAVLEPLAIASLYTDPSKEVMIGSPFVRTTGIVVEPNHDMPAEQLHFVINTIGIEDIVRNITDKQSAMHRQQSSYRQRTSVIDPDDNVGDDGFVL